MKKFHIRLLLFCIVITSIFTGCGKSNEPISKTGVYFDTVISVTLYDSAYSSQLEECFSMAEKYENLFSAKKEGTDIWRINHSQGQRVTVDDETIAILEEGIAYSKASNGTFDITVGALSDLWDFSENSNKVIPSQDEIDKALTTISYENIVIENNQVTLKNPDTKIDLGGIAKGYIADKFKEYLNDQGITEGIINLGGNVLTLGPKSGESKTYNIAIQKPDSTDGDSVASVKITDESVVTSGTYQRYFEVDGKRYHHILDLNTGYPVQNDLEAVTIIGPASLQCDALSTTVFLMGLDDGMDYVENLENVEAIFITTDGTIYHTSGIGTTIPYQEN